MQEQVLTFNDLIVLAGGVVMISTAIGFVFKLGSKIDRLADAIDRLASAMDDHEGRLRVLERNGD